ncbi:MAG: FtsX-like permease family protein [Bdellovibrionia bacterium]
MASRSSLIVLLARKFLLSQYNDGFLSYISWVSVLGVTLGVMALTVVTSVINGFEGQLTRVITGMNGEVLLYSRGDPVAAPQQVLAEVMKMAPEVKAISPSFISELMVSTDLGVSGAILQGFDPETLAQVTSIPRSLASGRLPESAGEVAVGSALADKIGAELGSEIRLVAPFAGGVDSAPRMMKARVVGRVRMGMYDYDSKFIFMTLQETQAFLHQPGRVTTFHLKLDSSTKSREVAERLTDGFGFPFRAKDWSHLNKNLFYAIRLEKVVIAIILTVIVIVAAFNVVSTLMMMIHDRSKEISILKAMGLKPSQGFGLFCWIGLGIGCVGTLGGMALGLALGWVINQTHWIQLPPDIYSIEFLSVIVRWKEIALIGVVALLIAFAATLYPSWKVARRSPLEGLRYDA